STFATWRRVGWVAVRPTRTRRPDHVRHRPDGRLARARLLRRHAARWHLLRRYRTLRTARARPAISHQPAGHHDLRPRLHTAEHRAPVRDGPVADHAPCWALRTARPVPHPCALPDGRQRGRLS